MLMYMYFSNNRCGTATIQERQAIDFYSIPIYNKCLMCFVSNTSVMPLCP